jgi:hypothetical protein
MSSAEPRYVAEFTRNDASRPRSAVTTPPASAPSASIDAHERPCRVLATTISSRFTTVPTAAIAAGSKKVVSVICRRVSA